MRVLYDAVDITALPSGGDLYAGYVNGRWPNANDIALREPGKRVLRIDVNGSRPDADVLDVETGDASPAQAPGAVAAGIKVVYCSVGDIEDGVGPWAECIRAMGGRVPPGGYWVADYLPAGSDPPTEIPAAWVARGCYAWQWYSDGYDQSIVADYWPGIDPAPEEEEEVDIVLADPVSGGSWCFTVDTGALYTEGGAPYVGAPNIHPDWKVGTLVGGAVVEGQSGPSPCLWARHPDGSRSAYVMERDGRYSKPT